jgi:serine/threonine protein kinase
MFEEGHAASEGLAAGGGGAVYLGVLHMTTDVAIKIISSPSPAQQRSFVREIMILKGCRHPNIIFFLGASVLSDRTLLVMEAMPGGDLCSQLRRDEKGRFRWGKRYVYPLPGSFLL